MKTLSRFDCVLIYIQLFLILLLAGLALLRDSQLSEISAAGTVIRYTGEAIIDTQALVKLEQSKSMDDRAEVEKLRKDISVLMNDLSYGNRARHLRTLKDQSYHEELSRLFMQWKKLESMIDVCRKSPENSIHLFMLSVEHYNQAKITLAAAENYSARIAEKIQLGKYAGSLLLSLIALVTVRLLYVLNKKTKTA